VSGQGSYTYLGATQEVAAKKSSNTSLYATMMESQSGSPMSSMNNMAMSAVAFHGSENLSDSTLGGNGTVRSLNGLMEEYGNLGKVNSDAISLGSNDSGGDVSCSFFLFDLKI